MSAFFTYPEPGFAWIRPPLVTLSKSGSPAGSLYLVASYPREGWEAYLFDDGQPRWERIAVAGHSQGGGHAAMTAKLVVVERAILFNATEPMPWTMANFVTPSTRLFGFVHTLEPIYTPISRSWDNLRLPGRLTSVDGASPPFGGSHRLPTGEDVCRGERSSPGFHHNCTVLDESFPFQADGKTPLFQAITEVQDTAVRIRRGTPVGSGPYRVCCPSREPLRSGGRCTPGGCQRRSCGARAPVGVLLSPAGLRG